MPESLQNAYMYIFFVCPSKQSWKTLQDDSPEVTQVVSGRVRSNLQSNFKFCVLPAIPGHLPGAKGVVKILVRKRDEIALENLGQRKEGFQVYNPAKLGSGSLSLLGSTQEDLTVILSFVLVYVFPVA